jgi:predicted RNA binding protein YcfA (HicA-like mRNA interferase family)
MKLPRNLSGAQLIKVLEKLAYQPTRQTGSHVRLATPLSKEHLSPYRCMTYYE